MTDVDSAVVQYGVVFGEQQATHNKLHYMQAACNQLTQHSSSTAVLQVWAVLCRGAQEITGEGCVRLDILRMELAHQFFWSSGY